MIEVPVCSECKKTLPVKRVREKRVSRKLEYDVVDVTNLSLKNGRYIHNSCKGKQ